MAELASEGRQGEDMDMEDTSHRQEWQTLIASEQIMLRMGELGLGVFAVRPRTASMCLHASRVHTNSQA